jgi:hypothetical protein
LVLRVQTGCALLSGLLALLTLVWRDWLEALGRDPDRGNGTAEWVAVLGLLLVAVGLGARAGREWRRLARQG